MIARQDQFLEYALFEKLFIIMPLMHSENEKDCQECANVLQAIIDNLKEKNESDSLVKVFELNKRWCMEQTEIL